MGRAAMLVAVLLGTCLIGACDFFRPEDPEPPPEGSFIVPNYSDPDSTLQALVLALADKGRTNGSTVYAGAFADSTASSPQPAYHHFFSPEDESEWIVSGRTVPADWGLDEELSFYNRLINLRGDDYRLEWAVDPPHPDERRADVAFLHRRYTLTTIGPDSSTTSTIAVGYTDLTLVRFSDGTWRIAIWQDRRDPGADPQDPEAVTLGRRRLNLVVG